MCPIIKLQYKLFIKVLKKIRLWNVNKANIIRSPQVYLHSCWAMPYLNHRRNKYTRSIKNTSKLIDTLCITNYTFHAPKQVEDQFPYSVLSQLILAFSGNEHYVFIFFFINVSKSLQLMNELTLDYGIKNQKEVSS